MSSVIALADNLHLARYRISLQPAAPVPLPAYKGSALRGALGHVLKDTVCVRPAGDLCQQCQLPDLCPYAFLYEGRPPSDTEVLSAANRIPPPYVLEPPLDRRQQLPPDELLTFHLTLVGSAVRYAPYLLAAFREVGRRGVGKARVSAQLVEANALLPNGDETPLYDPLSGSLLGQQPSPPTAREWAARPVNDEHALTLHFHTPTRLKYQGNYVEQTPPFHVVFRTLLRRISSFSYFYAGQQWDIDYRGWIDKAKHVEIADSDVSWQDWERYSTRQRRRMNLGGIVGTVTYTGNLAPFLPVIRLGELIHVGKGTTFGNGQYQVG